MDFTKFKRTKEIFREKESPDTFQHVMDNVTYEEVQATP